MNNENDGQDVKRSVDQASSKKPLDDADHIDPVEARKSVERAIEENKRTPKNEGGSAPIVAKPNRELTRDDREKEPISEEMRTSSAHEQAEDSVRDE